MNLTYKYIEIILCVHQYLSQVLAFIKLTFPNLSDSGITIFCRMRVLIPVWQTDWIGKNSNILIKEQNEIKYKKESYFVVFVDFHGVNTAIMVNHKLAIV